MDHRNYCNYVKKQLLQHAVHIVNNKSTVSMSFALSACQLNDKTYSSLTLLDMCCGRGGDLFKWDSLSISRVYALDSDQKSIEEAIKRYKEYRRRRKNPIHIHFYTISALSTDYIKKHILRNAKVNIVSCMFAMHYFCESRESLRLFLSNVSENLLPGGVFIGIAPDPTYIKKVLDPNDSYICSEEVSIRQADETNAYYFLIKDSGKCNNYFSFRGESLEYLIDIELFVSLAKEVSLELLEMKNITKLEADQPLVGVERSITSAVSELYFSFIFRRIEDPIKNIL